MMLPIIACDKPEAFAQGSHRYRHCAPLDERNCARAVMAGPRYAETSCSRRDCSPELHPVIFPGTAAVLTSS